MTSPPHEPTVPDGTLTPQTLTRLHNAEQDLYAKLRGQMAPDVDRVSSIFRNGLLAGIADAIRGVVRPGFETVEQAFRDGQMELINRLDLLDGLRGYCSTYMTTNVNLAWGVNNSRIMPFKAPVGPHKGARPETSQGGIVLEEAGAWLIGAKTTARGTGFTGQNEVNQNIVIYRPDGTVYSENVAIAQPGTQPETIVDTCTVVVPEPNYIVRVRTWSGRWRWYDGGTRFSRLWAVKQDSRIENAGAETVPDETR